MSLSPEMKAKLRAITAEGTHPVIRSAAIELLAISADMERIQDEFEERERRARFSDGVDEART